MNANNDLLFLKLGGSLLTDKTGVEALREDVLERLAAEIAAARAAAPRPLVLGHGSGSFGHVAGARYGTRNGVRSAEQWHGFAEVSAAAARLNRYVVEALLAEGVPAVSLQPSASAVCVDGQLTEYATAPIIAALAAELVPVVYGDVAFDTVRGGTIVSTEEIMDYLARVLRPRRMLLAGETPGVLDEQGQVIPLITPENLPAVRPLLGGSRGTDVTGGMVAKVEAMLALATELPDMTTQIFSGLEPGVLREMLSNPSTQIGTCLRR